VVGGGGGGEKKRKKRKKKVNQSTLPAIDYRNLQNRDA